uniref:Crystallin beta-gamma domain containing 2 n=1 Tax=Loxodonta africana TaxID=9785 RepID=G3TM58_LOXAF
MEEAGGPAARAEARVVSSTLTWRQRPPAREETRHRFHKVSLVSGTRTEASREFEYSHCREEVNGFATREEETVNYQGPRDEAGSNSFQSHGPIFSKKYTPPPKEKRPVGRLKEAMDQVDGSPQPPKTEPPGLGAPARDEFFVPLPGPRELSPHPGIGLTSEGPRICEERRVTRTVRTTTVVEGHVDRRVSSSVTVRPVLPGDALPRGRNAARTVRAVVVSPRAKGSPSHSQALELLTSLVPPEHSPPASRLPRPTVTVPRSPGLGSTAGEVLGQPPKTGAAEPKDRSALAPAGIPAGTHPSQCQHVPATHPDQDQGRAPEARTHEASRVQGASGPSQLSLQTSQGKVPGPSSPRLQTHTPSLGLVHPPEQPVVPIHSRSQHTLKPRVPHDLPSVKREGLTDPPATTTLPIVRNEVAMAPGQLLAPSSTKRKDVPSPGFSAPYSPSNNVVQDSEDISSFSLTQKEVVQGPGVPVDPSLIQKEVVQGPGTPAASSPEPIKVVQGPEGSPSSSSTQKEVAQGIEGSLAPSFTNEEVVQGPITPATPSPKQVAQGSEGTPISSPTQKQDVQDSGASAIPFSTQKMVVQGLAVLPVPSSSVDKVSPSPGSPPITGPLETEASLKSRLVPDSTKDKVLPEPSREEDEVALTADLEIFLDTLRSMEPPEILRTQRMPRAPRSSYLAMYATLPAIEEDQLGPWVPGPGPQEVPAQPENPYLSDDEKLQRRQEKAGPSPSWETRPAKAPQDFLSPLEMMKKHVTGVKGSHPELGPEWQAGSRPTSRLGGSLLFGGLVPATKSPTEHWAQNYLLCRPTGTGLRKVPGQLPIAGCGEATPHKASYHSPLSQSPALKTQGKLNTRPGKMILFSEPSCQGSSREVWEDIADASGWALVASIRVVRGCWVLYEEPEFQGRKLVLPEGDVELQAPGTAWSPKGIGSLRRVVQDYSTPEISLFSEEDLKGEQVKLTQALENSEGLGRPLQVASITVFTGLWLLYPKPFFEDTPCILEPGEYHTLEACGTTNLSVGSLKPVTLGSQDQENPGSPAHMLSPPLGWYLISVSSAGLPQCGEARGTQGKSLRVKEGLWGREGNGAQKLGLGGWSLMGSLATGFCCVRSEPGGSRLILGRAISWPGWVFGPRRLPTNLTSPLSRPQAVHVLSGVWVAYQEVGFSGKQYVLEKGVYRNCEDWGAGNSALASLQPVLQVGEHNLHFVSKIQLFSGPDFLGDHISFEDDQASLPFFQPQSCRVHGGSWILFDEKNFEGDQHVLSEGEFPTLTAMGCLASTVLGSLQKVPLSSSEP